MDHVEVETAILEGDTVQGATFTIRFKFAPETRVDTLNEETREVIRRLLDHGTDHDTVSFDDGGILWRTSIIDDGLSINTFEEAISLADALGLSQDGIHQDIFATVEDYDSPAFEGCIKSLKSFYEV